MKQLRAIVCAVLAVLAFASCEKNEGQTNKGDAKVGFEQSEYLAFMEDAPNFDIPVSVSGSNIAYPVVVKIKDIKNEVDEEGNVIAEVPYSERNVDYRFLEREVVINSPEDKPVVTVRLINNEAPYLYVGVELEVISNCTVENAQVELTVIPEGEYRSGYYVASGKAVVATQTGVTYQDYQELWYLLGDYSYQMSMLSGYLGIENQFSTEENPMYPLYGQFGRYDFGEPLGERFIYYFTLDSDNVMGAVDMTPYGIPYVCMLVPMVSQGQNLWFGEMFVYANEDDTFSVLIPENPDVTSEDPIACSIGLFLAETGQFTGYTLADFVVQSVDPYSPEATALTKAFSSVKKESVEFPAKKDFSIQSPENNMFKREGVINLK